MRTARLKAPNYRAMLNSSIYGDDSPVHAVPGVPHMQYNASAGYGSGDDGSAGGEEQEEEEGYEGVCGSTARGASCSHLQ